MQKTREKATDQETQELANSHSSMKTTVKNDLCLVPGSSLKAGLSSLPSSGPSLEAVKYVLGTEIIFDVFRYVERNAKQQVSIISYFFLHGQS